MPQPLSDTLCLSHSLSACQPLTVSLLVQSNAFVDGMEQKLKEDLDESGCLPRGPCPERARIHGVVFEELIERSVELSQQLAKCITA